MQTVEARRVMDPDAASELVGSVVPAQEPTPLEPDTVVRDAETGDPLVGYFALRDPGPLRKAVLKIDCSGGVQRQKVYRSRSRTFGYAPRRPVTRREACSVTSLNVDQPDVGALLETYADQFSDMLKQIDPAIVERDLATVGAVLPDWRMGKAKLWTSGVVNDTAQLPYHRDGFNFGTWSAMPVVRRGTRGGYLHLPEYDLTLECADSTVSLFQGFRLVHGVTPITRVKAGEGYRISVVYYALRGMKNCREAAEEAAYGQRRRTEREAEMAKRLAVGDRQVPGKGDRKADRQAFAGWRNTGNGDRPWNSMAPRQ